VVRAQAPTSHYSTATSICLRCINTESRLRLLHTRADDCDHTLMKSRSESETDKFSPLLHVYDMDVTNGPDDAQSGVPGTTRRDMGPPAELQARAKAADEAGWSAAKGWVSEPGGVSSPSPWGPAAAQ
jgi:hypothetical protein